MALVIPEKSDEALGQVVSQAERLLYVTFRDELPDDVTVVHSMEWIQRTREGFAIDAEADFVVVHPEMGILVVEVKGGGVGHDASTGSWYSVDRTGKRHSIKDPARQAKVQKYSLRERIREDGRLQLRKKFTLGHGVFFPDIAGKTAITSPELPSEIVGDSSDLGNLGVWVEAVFRYWASGTPADRGPGTEWRDAVVDLLTGSFEVRPILGRQIEDEEAVRIKLTEQQAHVLRVLSRVRRALISGGAGTGKTMLALKRAREFASAQIDTLFVCFNRPLADFVREEVGLIPHLTVLTFHQLCEDFVRKATKATGTDFLTEVQEAEPSADFYEQQLPMALSFAAECVDEKFDAIVVDEAQDFRDSFWPALEDTLRNRAEGWLYIFHDPNQRLYRSAEVIPIGATPLLLTRNCRNTRAIHDAAYHFYAGDATEPPPIAGVPVGAITAPTPPSQVRRLHSEIISLISCEKLEPKDIVVLIAGKVKEFYFSQLSGLSLPGGASWGIGGRRSNNEILVDTVSRYKGLESPCVFLWGVDDLSPDVNCETFYVGLSRAKSALWIVGHREAVERIIPHLEHSNP